MIIPMSDDVLDEAVSVWLEASFHAHHFIDRNYWLENESAMRDIYIPNSESWVFVEAGKVTGFYSLSGETLAALFVLPESHGKGVGSLLLSHAKEQVERLELTVYTENKRAVEFYKKRGFSVCCEQEDKHTGHAEYAMEWSGGRS